MEGVEQGTSSETMKKTGPMDLTTSKRMALEVPEIVEHVTKFLSNSDLLTCTLLNKTWEGEARKKLLTNVLLDFSTPEVTQGYEVKKVVKNDFAQKVASYTEAMKPRGAYHSKLQIGEIKSVHECNVIWYLINRKLKKTWPIYPNKWTHYFLEMMRAGIKGPESDKWLDDVKSPPAEYFDEQKRFLVLLELIGLRVKELSMIWPSPKDVAYFCEVLSKFTNLTQLELVVTVPIDKEEFEEEHFSPDDPRLASLKTKFPAGFVLPSVKRLIIKFDYSSFSEYAYYIVQKEVKDGLARAIVELCPNMEFLYVDGCGKIFGQEIGRDASRFANLTKVNFDFMDEHQVGILSLPLPLRVIHVQFGMGDELRILEEIFNKFSNTLEDFKMGVEMMLWETVDPESRMIKSTIRVPKMPNLKKIHISVLMSFTPKKEGGEESRAPRRPAVNFVFDTATENQKIDYDLQFPSLTTIVIRGERRNDPYKHKVLYDFFTPQVDPPCTTVRYLDIVYPPEDKEFLDRNPDCATGCNCWIWKNDITQLYKRMAETFPNVKDERFTPFRK